MCIMVFLSAFHLPFDFILVLLILHFWCRLFLHMIVQQVICYTGLVFDRPANGGIPFCCHSGMDSEWLSFLDFSKRVWESWKCSTTSGKEGGNLFQLDILNTIIYLSSLSNDMPAWLHQHSYLLSHEQHSFSSKDVHAQVGIRVRICLLNLMGIKLAYRILCLALPWTVQSCFSVICGRELCAILKLL